MTLPRGQPTGRGDEKGRGNCEGGGDLSFRPSWPLIPLGRAKSQMKALAAGPFGGDVTIPGVFSRGLWRASPIMTLPRG